MRWHYHSDGTPEDLITSDWAKLTLLEPSPRISIGPANITVLAPEGKSVYGLFEITGRQADGNLPVFIRTHATERRASRSIKTGSAGTASPITNWSILASDFIVVDEERSYEQGLDFTVDSASRFIAKSATANKTLTIVFTELYPAYQCSTNQQDWSPLVMLDTDRPYVDGEYKSPVVPDGDLPDTG